MMERDGRSKSSGGMAGKSTLTSHLTVQRREAAEAAGRPGKSTLTSQLAVQDAATRGIATPTAAMPHADRIQAAFGADHDVSSIQAHVGGDAAAACADMNASAFASGSHAVFAGAPDLHTAAHEAAHVVQQAQGVNLYGGVGTAGDAYERHADAVADRVVAGRSVADLFGSPRSSSPSPGGSVQRREIATGATSAGNQETSATQHGAEQAGADANGASPKAQKFTVGAPKDFATAQDRHRANLELLKKLLDEGKDLKDSKWGKSYPNACQWLLAGKTVLHALTETHDSAARATRLGGGTMRAFFGSSTPVPTMSTYDEHDQTKAANIELVNPSWLGYRSAGSPSKVVIVDPVTKDKELVKETITHEVQHDADHHGTSDFERYQTEFDAYWIDKTYSTTSSKTGTANDSLAAADGTVMSGFDNARQQTIFLHLYNSTSYSYVATGWGVAAFKAKVLALKSPKGMNLVNSARIDDLYLALTKSPPDIAAAKTKLTKLNDHDRAAIVNSSMIDSWRTVVGALPKAEDQTFFKKALVL